MSEDYLLILRMRTECTPFDQIRIKKLRWGRLEEKFQRRWLLNGRDEAKGLASGRP
jgi:hypothetical protein